MITFVQLNCNKNIDSNLKISNEFIEPLNKYITSNSLSDEHIEDLTEYLIDNNFIKILKKDDPIMYINDYFKGDSKDDNIYYNIYSYDYSSDLSKIYLILADKNKMCITMTKDIDYNSFNQLGSILLKYHTNSNAIFGDIFLVSIDSKYYKSLCEKEKDEETEKKKEKIEYMKLYHDFNTETLIRSYKSIYFINIFVEPNRYEYPYDRSIIDNLIKTTKYEIVDGNIIKVKYENLTIYTKFTDPLFESSIMISNMAGGSNDYHLINIDEDDIKKIIKS
jgi:hypothetical protein